MDTLNPKRRSEVMARIRSKDTAPEIAVRKMLHSMGFRFRLHSKDLPGKPDIVLAKYKTVILVHGCFWHRHPHCKYAYVPKSRTEFWQKKFEYNQARDLKVRAALLEMGWHCCVVWECETFDREKLRERLVACLCS
jgi:DNA mismatch endonuclease (patch repair protein)